MTSTSVRVVDHQLALTFNIVPLQCQWLQQPFDLNGNIANTNNHSTSLLQGSQVGLPLLVPPPPAAGRCGPCIYEGSHLNSRYGHLGNYQLGRFIRHRGHERPDLAPYSFSDLIGQVASF